MAVTSYISFSTVAIIAISLTLAVGATASFPTEEKTHLHLFIHERLNPPNRTGRRVAPPNRMASPGGAFPFAFGDILIVDDFLTEGPDPGSRLIGRAQGLGAAASLSGSDLLLILSLAFTEPGPHEGSSLVLLSRDPIREKVRELSVVGGTGQFRMARGYALLGTEYVNTTTGRVILEVDFFVLHYPATFH